MKINSDTILNFGKYLGESATTIVIAYPEYILWLDDNTDHIISNKLYLEAREQVEQGEKYVL